MRVIFLDFDGVLHGDRGASGMLTHVERLAETLVPYPDVQIVISSSWRSTYPFEMLCHFLSPVDTRVVGVIPSLKEESRQAEIEAWLETKPEVESWLAIDDMPHLFQVNCPWLLVTNPMTGFDQNTWRQLNVWLKTDSLPSDDFFMGKGIAR